MPTPVIVYGNPCDGITVIGPFGTVRDAEAWAKARLDTSDGDQFWSTPLYSPDEFMKNKTESVKPTTVIHTTGQTKGRALKRFFIGGRWRSRPLSGIFAVRG